jgi:hypothetical protein
VEKDIKGEKGASMKVKGFSLLLLALVFIASLAVVGCGGKSAEFTVSNLVINPTSVEAGGEVEISVTVTNSGGASGSYTADLTVGGTAAGSQTVEVAAGASATVHFDYTTAASGTLTVAIGSLSGTLTVTPGTGYWDIPYKSIEGSYLVLDFSVGGITPLRKIINFNESSGIRFTMRVNQSVVDGAREVSILPETWVWPEFEVPDIMTGVDMILLVGLNSEATGTLYVQSGIGDVDTSSESTAGQSPIQVNTYGDGTKDPAGSLVIPMELLGEFDTTVGQEGELPINFVFTTGHTDNTVHISINKKMDGKFMESDGALFAEDGGVADYTGTAGTITEVGTGECLGIKLVGIRIDIQLEIKFVLEPVSD